MSSQVQELINKIKSEGVAAADQQAKEIQAQAKQKADAMVNSAKKEADHLILAAKEEIKKLQESTQMALKQASRDTILSLKKEIEHILQEIIVDKTKDALTPDVVVQLIEKVIHAFPEASKKGASIEVGLNVKDLEALKKGALSKLQGKIKEPFTVRASDDVGKGFTISFDAGKSSFDFTDQSVAHYLSSFLSAQVAELVKDSV